ncbi:DUF362 domain-containing protein [Thermosynechococcaceae cyanobacterium BACA0444]|uniref:DUF362 domain-containing protein n=1 Tax=Pseudocalidococcus azoricus BACA0444 TaxID=2918990 RepID=A0AAE4JYR2_9CYAN|nr:DUF362 domain-containing protein [Pseudocalidococcus azoricus]MDS3861254.1 DUF362 domain-containing protein [Pseudocalidococcus azoricus BACA0444]
MTVISLVQHTNYDYQELAAKLTELLAPLGGLAAIVKPGDRVLLKPNLLTGARPTKECVTRPEIVYCLTQMIRAVGGQPFLGDGPAFGTALGVARANGYLPVIQDLQLPVIEFHGERYETVSQEFNHLRLSKEAMSADVIINLPKVKSHVQLTLTMGVKNLFGCVPGKMKAWWHMEAGKDRDRFGRMLVETARAIQPDLTIMDGIIGHEGNGPSGGEPRPLNLLGASTNVFALDQAIATILQADFDQVPTLKATAELGLSVDLAQAEFPLLKPQDLQIDDWQFPSQLVPIDFGAPRVLKSTFKHLYVRWIKEPLSTYGRV